MAGRSPFDRSHSGFQSIRDEESEFAPPNRKKRSGRCCCLPIWLCFMILLILIAGLAIALFFLWPRLPTVTYLESKMVDDQKPFTLQDKKLDTKLEAKLSLKNPNYIPLSLKNVTLELSIPVEGGSDVTIGHGYLPQSINFPAQQTTNFTLQAQLEFDLKSNDKNNIQAIKKIVENCKSNQKLNLNYFAKSDVPLISWTGYQPSFTGKFDVKCPFKDI